MKFDLTFDRVYAHPVEKVWGALVDPEALGQWLMETDFVAETGRAFTMRCDDGEGGTDTYICTLLEFDPPNRMLWSWVLDGSQHRGDTFVEFTVEPVPSGTKVTITHTGDRDSKMIEKLKGGWPSKLDQLGNVLAGAFRGT